MFNRSRKLNTSNDTLIVAQADGEEVELNNTYRSGGDLCEDDEGFAAPIPGRKIPEYAPTRIGHPPLQHKLVYDLDYEPLDCGRDDEFCHRHLPAIYRDAANRKSRQDELDKKRHQLLDIIFILCGVALLFHSFFLAPWLGWSLSGGSETQPPAQTAPPPDPTPTPSIIINEGVTQ